jgi:hypothetical protein
MLGFWILVLLIILVLAALPSWPYSRGWGVGPVGILLVLLIIWLVLVYLGTVTLTFPWATSVAPATPA